jgi:exosortase A-associated hydrolase 1
MAETPVVLTCASDELVGIVHLPESGARALGVLIVVGGPQYRVGSHRQFVLMARLLAAAGYPTLRFDYRGMGDSTGDPRTFESVDDDIRAAIDALVSLEPTVRGVVILGLCDAASAALMYCRGDARLRGLILINPWVRTEAGAAQAVVRHYYGRRLFMRSFWAKVFSGQFQAGRAVRSFIASLRTARKERLTGQPGSTLHFVERMLGGFCGFKGPKLVLLSARDLTAREFEALCRKSPEWSQCLAGSHVDVANVVEADHTFSSRTALQAATARSVSWLNALREGA